MPACLPQDPDASTHRAEWPTCAFGAQVGLIDDGYFFGRRRLDALDLFLNRRRPAGAARAAGPPVLAGFTAPSVAG